MGNIFLNYCLHINSFIPVNFRSSTSSIRAFTDVCFTRYFHPFFKVVVVNSEFLPLIARVIYKVHFCVSVLIIKFSPSFIVCHEYRLNSRRSLGKHTKRSCWGNCTNRNISSTMLYHSSVNIWQFFF